ncbi:SNF2 family N-terminal domain-containing protein [Tirmania nivea]|nr:SNF2 family N-terminal domain-containing protein [Tirmania nivea]
MYQRWVQMRSQGVTEADPEFAQMSAILRAMRAQNISGQQQQQHSGQQRVSQNGVPQVNGKFLAGSRRPVQQATSQTPLPMQQSMLQENASATPQRRSTQDSANSHLSPATSNVGGNAQKTTPTSQSFTQDQLAILRHQIMAFKLISKNMPVPPQIQNAIFAAGVKPVSVSTVIAAVNATIADTSGEPVPGSDKAESAAEAQETESGFKSYASPWSRLQNYISYMDHGSRDKRLVIPSIMPSGIDIAKLQEERERVIYNRITARRAELESLPSNLAHLDLKSENVASDDLMIKALIEYKSLCLLQKQRALRQEVVNAMVHTDNLAVTSNRPMYRRMKKQSLREARITEKLEKQQRDQREMREKKKHHDYLQSIMTHGRNIQNIGKVRQGKQQKLGRMMLQHHQHMEKEEQKRIERTAKQRLQALKANDEEAYLKLLAQTKDTRITHILKQTDGFLNSLAESVRAQQRDAIQNYGRPEGYVDEDESSDEEDEDGNKKIDYYAVAHRIQEMVTEQPSILVGGRLKEYQIKGLQWMVSLYNNSLNGILADEMGLGKTIQTISLVTFLIEKKKQNGPFLVIVPLSTLTNWTMEFEKWAPSVSKIVYKGPPMARKQQQNQIKYSNFQVLLTTYEYIIKDRPILSKIKWNYMIIDEGHRMKNNQSKLTVTLTTYYNCRFRLILTGTPLQNNLPELWALLNFVLPNIFKSVKSFDEWFNTPFANTGGQDKMELSEEESLLVIRRLHKVLRPFLLRRLKKDVESELPDKKEEVIKCKLSALQSVLYKQLVERGSLFIPNAEKGGKVTSSGLSNTIMQLRKVCNHPFIFEEVEKAINPSGINNDLLWRTAGKFELLDRLLPKFFATGHRVLMFFQMTKIMNIMEDYLHLKGFRYLRLDGTTKADDRSSLLKEFNAPESPYFMFMLSTRAGGLGLNLQTADTVIIFDSDWNPHQDLQAQDRAHRIGQKNEVRILRLITTNSIEEKILERAQYKLDIDGKVIQAGKFDNKSTNEERDALLRSLLEAGSRGDNEGNEEMDDDELNEIIARNESELDVFRKLDRERNAHPRFGEGLGKKARLFPENEVPSDINLIPEVPEVEAPKGRGARERNNVRYDDGLTEEQWLDAMDDDEDTVEDAIKRKRERIERRQSKKLARQQDSPPPPETPVRDASTPPPTTQKRKRGRQPKAKETPAKAREPEPEPESVPKRKRPRGGKVDSMSPGDRAIYQRVFETIYDAVVGLEDPEDGRLYAEHFFSLPSRKLYPTYYQFIKSPISYDMIKKKIDKEQYASLGEFRYDFMLMYANARTFNEPGSGVYIDAERMEEEFKTRLQEQVEANSDVLSLDPLPEPGAKGEDGEGAGNGVGRQSTTTMSSENGTPMAAPTPNIRLKFKNPAAHMHTPGGLMGGGGGSGSSAQSPESD